jgi:diguanylate cyclase (GGDEF)-like protein
MGACGHRFTLRERTNRIIEFCWYCWNLTATKARPRRSRHLLETMRQAVPSSQARPECAKHARLWALCGHLTPARVAIAAAILGTALTSLAGALSFPDQKLSDAWFGLGNLAPSGRIALVSFDHAATRYANATRVPRRDLADLLLRLDAAGAARILIEVGLGDQAGEPDDTYLEHVLARLGHKVAVPVTAVLNPSQTGWRRTGPMDRFARHVTRTASDLVLDRDGELRKFGIEDSGLRPLVASPVWLTGANADRGPEGDPFRIDFGIDLQRIPLIDATSILQTRSADAGLSGASVIVAGLTSPSGGGFRVPRYGDVTRAQVTALAAETLGLGRDLRAVPGWKSSIGLMMLAAVVALCCVRLNGLGGAAIGAGAVLGGMGAAAALQISTGLTAPAAGIVAAVLLGFVAAQVAVHPIFQPLRQAATALLAGVDITAQRAQIEALSRIASQDPLTGLQNRRAFEEGLDQACAGSTEPLGLLLCDLDGFKQVNDTLGHAAGDALLREIARRLVEATKPHGVVARLGGDEFGILLPESTPTLAATTAERIIGAIARPIRIGIQTGTQGITVGVSIGIALGFPNAQAQALMESADAAMYDAKRNGSGYGFGRARGALSRLQQVG